MSQESSNLSERMDQRFEQNYALVQEFLANPQGYLDRLVVENPEAAEKCFNASKLQICCIDGRLHQGNLAIAGSGCLYEHPDEAINYAKQMALEQGKKITGITSHEHCGAAGMKQIDAQQFSQELARQIQVPYAGHLSVDLPEFHDEVTVYYSGTNSLGLQDLLGLPRGFRLSRRYYPSVQAALYEVEVATQIAFGDHGLGLRFTIEKPLIIVALGDASVPQFSASALARELASLESDRVKVVAANYQPERAAGGLALAA